LLGEHITRKPAARGGERFLPKWGEAGVEGTSILHLGYYRNQVVHVFKDEAVVALSLASFGLDRVLQGGQGKGEEGIEKEELLGNVRLLHRLWREEFIPSRDEFLEEGDFELSDLVDSSKWKAVDSFYSNILDTMVRNSTLAQLETKSTKIMYVVPPSGEKYFSWLCSLYWPFVDSYWLAGLSALSALPDYTVQETVLVDRAQWLADRFFREGIISHFESVSRDAIRNALTVFVWMGILKRSGNSVQLQRSYTQPNVTETFVERISRFRKAERSWRRGSGKGVMRYELLADFPIVAKM